MGSKNPKVFCHLERSCAAVSRLAREGKTGQQELLLFLLTHLNPLLG